VISDKVVFDDGAIQEIDDFLADVAKLRGTR